MGLGNFLFGDSDQEQLDKDLDAKLRAMNDKDYGPGGRIYNTIQARDGAFAADQAYQTVQGHEATQEQSTATEGQQLDDAFNQGLNEGAANIRGAVDSTVWGTVKLFLKTIPVSVWIAAVIVAFVYFGGWAWLTAKALKGRR